MKKAPTDSLDESLAAEIALREHIKAVLACSITGVGESYTLTAQVIDPQSRMAVQTESAQARGKDAVLPALDELATRVRRNLGESLNSVTAQNVALPRATTPSLEALGSTPTACVPRRDRPAGPAAAGRCARPGFCPRARRARARVYLSQNRQHRQEGEAHFVKALGLLDRLSHRERLWISALAEDSRGNRDAAVRPIAPISRPTPTIRPPGSGWAGPIWRACTNTRRRSRRSNVRSPSIPPVRARTSTSRRRIRARKIQGGGGAVPAGVRPEPSFADRLADQSRVRVRAGPAWRSGWGGGEVLADARRKVDREPGAGPALAGAARHYRGRYGSAIDHLRQAMVINKTNNARVSEYPRSPVSGARVPGERDRTAVCRRAGRRASARHRLDARAGVAPPGGQDGGAGRTGR